MKQYRVFANWYYIALFVLAGMKNIDWAHSTLAATLGNEITEEQVGAALVDLCEVGLLKKNGGRYERISNRLTTAEDLRSGAMFRYHKQMISMADKALELPLEQREMNAITIGIAKRRLPELKEKIRKFRKEINEIFTPDEADAEQVYQLNLHLFPITKPIAPLKEGKV